MTSSPAGRRPEKGRRYHELLEALDERGCPVCRLAEESVEDAISAILHEQVNDAAFREQFLASGGFCRHHAWRLVLQHDILGTAILYRALLRDAGRHRRVAAHCQLCLSYESGEGSALDILEYGLDEATFADKFAQSDGLCDPPLRDGPSPPGRQGCPSPAAGGDKTAFAVPARRAHPEAGLQVRRRTERGRGRLVATCSQRRRRYRCSGAS